MRRVFREVSGLLSISEHQAVSLAKGVADATASLRTETICHGTLNMLMDRIDTWMAVAFASSRLSCCSKAQVGCVFTNWDLTAPFVVGRNTPLLKGCTLLPDGKCDCVHAEASMLQSLPPGNTFVVFTTIAPCRACAGLLLTRHACAGLVYLDELRKPSGLELLREYGLNPLSWRELEVARQTLRLTPYEKTAFERMAATWLE